jgi:hypothetical protein
MTKSEEKKLFDELMDDAGREYEARFRSHPHLDLITLVHLQDCGDRLRVLSGLVERADAVRVFRSPGTYKIARSIARHPWRRTMVFRDEVAGVSYVVFKPRDHAGASRN